MTPIPSPRPPLPVLRSLPSALRPPPSALRPPPSALRLLLSALCSPPSAFCSPPSAFCSPPSAFCSPPSAFCLLLFALCLPSPPASAQDDAPLTIADLDSYRAALRADDPSDPPPEPVTFGDLWDRPDDFLGRRVAIEGRAARRFRQPRIGEYPPLVELWLSSKTGNPTCVVYPEPDGGDPTPLGATVRFSGTYQKRVRYEAGDEPRLAPLLVGPGAPEVLRGPARGDWRPIGPFRGVDWMVGAIVAAAVASAIVRQILARPRPRRRDRDALEGPPPRFIDEGDDSYNDPSRPDGPPDPDHRGPPDAA